MRALTASELLEVCERGQTQTPPRRALSLLGAACPELSPDALAQLGIGRRDARLLTLREWMFGPQLTSLATCPECHQQVELNINADDLRVASVDGVAGEDAPDTFTLRAGDYEVKFRLPNSLDLEAIADSGQKGIGAAKHVLLERCLLTIERAGEEVAVKSLPDDVIKAAVERMQQVDPQADIQLALACPQCGARWQEQFDIESFFWDEISAWAERLLSEVHIIASRYGWRERDILNMTALRRHHYLNLING